jgi:hypothetical protein
MISVANKDNTLNFRKRIKVKKRKNSVKTAILHISQAVRI